MNLVAMQMVGSRRTLKMTVLHRPGGAWDQLEVGRLVNGLKTEVCRHPLHPEHLVLFGHYTKEATLKAMWGGVAYTARQIIGTDHKDLPFVPGFA